MRQLLHLIFIRQGKDYNTSMADIIVVVSSNGTTTGVTTGSGSPESVVAAPVGSLFLRSDGGPGTAVYGKLSGVGNTGWVTFAPITSSATATMTNCTWVTNTTVSAFMTRVGDQAWFRVRIQTSGAPTTASLSS